MLRVAPLLAGLALIVFVARLPAQEKPPVQGLLEHAVLGPSQTLSETQDYLEARVPRMPDVRSAEGWEKEANRIRAAVLDRVVYRGEAVHWRDTPLKVDWQETIPGGPGYRIKKLRYEAVPGLWIPALLYEPENLTGKVPAILNVNGHDANGKAARYKQIRCINQAKRGMLALNVEWLGMGQLRSDGFQHARMNQLDLCGTSGLAPYYLSMKRSLDVLLSLEHTDPSRVAVTGLSGGGWQTIFISSLDPRVKLTDPVAGYSSFLTRIRHFKDLGDSEQTPCDLATVADYTHLTAMMAPRPTLLTFNSKDNCCFESGYALPPLVAAAKPIFKLYGKEEALRTHVNSDPGTHNYERDNREAFYKMVGDFFYPGDASYKAEEIPCTDEVKSKEDLSVALPAENADFHRLALALSRALPEGAELPDVKAAAQSWQQKFRNHLRSVLKTKDYAAQATEAGTEAKGEVKATFWRVKLSDVQKNDVWTVPVVELVQGEPKGTALVIADGGRGSAAATVEQYLKAGQRVLAMDPFYFGEAKIEQRDWLFALTVSTVGDRPLGLQASQMAAVARWAHGERKQEPVTLIAVGPRTSTIALAAAGLEESAISRLELQGAMGSLKQVLEDNRTVQQVPELFCFGLLQTCDIKQLAALVAPREIVFRDASPRVRTELGGLKQWYATLGSAYDPLP